MTFIEICQSVYREGGISGNITSVQNQSGEALRVVKWSQQAYQEILNDQALNWNFQHQSFAEKLVIGQGTYTFAELNLDNGVQWDVNSMRVAVNDNFSDETFLIGQRFPQFRDYWLFSSRRDTVSRPLNASVDNQTNLRIAPIPDQEYWLIGQYLEQAPLLADDTDIPAIIPARFHNIIVWRALRHYGMFEAAPEVVSRADHEYKTVLQQLYNDQTYEVIVGEPMC